MPNERCCSQRHCGTLCNCAALRAAPFTAILLEPLQQNAALDGLDPRTETFRICGKLDWPMTDFRLPFLRLLPTDS